MRAFCKVLFVVVIAIAFASCGSKKEDAEIQLIKKCDLACKLDITAKMKPSTTYDYNYSDAKFSPYKMSTKMIPCEIYE